MNPASSSMALESLSLRQRAPAMLLKKLDEFEERAQRVWARHEMQKHMQEDVERQAGDNRKGVWGNNRQVGTEDQWGCHFEHSLRRTKRKQPLSYR